MCRLLTVLVCFVAIPLDLVGEFFKTQENQTPHGGKHECVIFFCGKGADKVSTNKVMLF